MTDPKAKEAFDAVIRVKLDRLKRLNEMDDKRRKFREDLNERESEVRRGQEEAYTAKQRLQQELERLREEGLKRQREHEREIQEAFLEQQQQQKARERTKEDSTNVVQEIDRTLKVKWKRKKYALNEDDLRRLIEPYGQLEHIIISSKQKSALIVFKSLVGANQLKQRHSEVLQFESVDWASGHEPEALRAVESNAQDYLDYETVTLLRMQQMVGDGELKRKREELGNEKEKEKESN